MARVVAAKARLGSEAALSKQQIVSLLTRSPHGNLDEYLPVGLQAAREDPEFYSHLVAWNDERGQVRDAKVALPIVQLATMRGTPAPPGTVAATYRENALAHLAKLSPRDLVRASMWAKGKIGNHPFADMVRRYLRTRELDTAWWDRTVLAHRRSMRRLYQFFHIRRTSRVHDILFCNARPAGSVFEALSNLGSMASADAAAAILNYRLPFLSVMGALRGKPSPEIGLALIERMSPTDLVTNTGMLEKIGVKTDPAMRAAYEAKLGEVAKSKKVTLKAARAAEVVGGSLGKKLVATQERQIDALGAVKGSWLVLVDISQSMHLAIDIGRQVAAILARVTEETHLVFFNTEPRYVNATGKSYEELVNLTRGVVAMGGTSVGCGLAYIQQMGVEVGGIAIISDAQENNLPFFADQLKKYSDQIGKVPTTYLYRLEPGSRSVYDTDVAESMRRGGLEMQEFDIRGGVDAYSLPNLVGTMRSNRYSLVDEIMSTPLITLDDVFGVPKEAGELVTA